MNERRDDDETTDLWALYVFVSMPIILLAFAVWSWLT